MPVEESVKVVVVGAGFAGLSAAKGYIQCAPHTNLVVLDNNQTIGGTWAKERLYEGLRSNNLRSSNGWVEPSAVPETLADPSTYPGGTLEFPDCPLHDGFGVQHGQHLPGTVVHDYLAEYAKHWNIPDRIRFKSKVLDADKVNTERASGWRLTVQTLDREYTLFTEKLIVATGLTSQPQPMHINGEGSYHASIINTANIANQAPRVLDDPHTKRVTVFGGSKSAYDAVYMFASAGKNVDWVIRKSGHGPTWMSNTHIRLPIGLYWAESLVTRRILAWMSPCLWGGLDGSGLWRSFLHQTWLGRKVADTFWWKLSSDTLEQAGYTSDDKLKPLIPDCSMFDIGTSFAILNYLTDILDYVRSEDLAHLSDHVVRLADGTQLESDALIASTGWLFGPAIHFKVQYLHSELGIPSTDYAPEQKAFWARLDQKADKVIFRRWPQLAGLKYPPRTSDDMKENPLDEVEASEPRKEYPPARMYRALVPPGLAAKGDRSLAFAGFLANITQHIKNEIAGLWIYAYLNDKLSVDPCRDVDDVYWEAALFNRFCSRRYPYGFGRRFPDFIFDAIPFNDLLLHDLGMSGKRKGGSWYRECFEPYGMSDYRGITAEWLEQRKQSADKKLS